MTKFIVISGKKNVGKDTLADGIIASLQANGYTAKKVSFADPLKQACHIIFGIPLDDMYTLEGKEKATHLRWNRISGNIREQFLVDDGIEPTGFLTVREVLQLVGTQLFRQQIDENVWACAPFKINDVDFVVVSDCRYPNELQAAKDAGAYTIRISRDGLPNEDTHISERALDGVLDSQFNIIVKNNGSLRGLRKLADDIAGSIIDWSIA